LYAVHAVAHRSDEIRTILIHPGERLLPELSATLSRYAQRQLARRHVEVMLHTKVAAVGEGSAEITPPDGDTYRLPTRLVVWAAGVAPSPVIGTLDVKRSHHAGVVVKFCCDVVGHRGVWALGDCAGVGDVACHL